MNKYLVRAFLEHDKDAENVEFSKEFDAPTKERAIELANQNCQMMVEGLAEEFDGGEFQITILSCEQIK